MIHAHQPIWLPSHVTVEKSYRGESAGLTAVFIRFDHCLVVFQENRVHNDEIWFYEAQHY